MVDCSPPHIHLVGVCGSGMKALAELLLDTGCSISGSDLQSANPSIRKLIDRGLVFHEGHAASHLPAVTQQLVYSSAIPEQNPERQEVVRRQLPEFSYSQMVGKLMRQSTGVCIAGTHGKSTTTAMIASILLDAGRLSAAVLGAELRLNGRSGWTGAGDLFVAESCEFQRSFLDFFPRYSVILNIEPDHFDCYPDADSLTAAFLQFANQTAADGVLLFHADCPLAASVATSTRTQARRVSYGMRAQADWMADECQATPRGMKFRLIHEQSKIAQIELNLPGLHNVHNALASAAVCAEIGVPVPLIAQTLGRFQGIRRRFENLGAWNGATWIDDYAHHPTAVKSTLETLRPLHPDRRILCLFQPHQISRTTALMDDFSRSFDQASEVWLAPVFAARESVTDEPVRVSQELAGRLNSRGVFARSFASLDQMAATLEDSVRPGDIIVTMGAGDIDRIHHDCTRRIP